MILNYAYQHSTRPSKGTLLFIHGLFGSFSNLGMLARAFENDYDIVQIDLRNHGESAHDPIMNYSVMAQDVIETLAELNIDQFSVIGHSMGAKVAMKLTEYATQRLEKLVILDMSPFAYTERHHDRIFRALFAVEQAKLATRKEATEIMQSEITEMGVIQFLLKSFNKGQWTFNLTSLYDNYSHIMDWQQLPAWNQPTLFIRGAESDYIAKDQYLEAIKIQFPQSRIETVEQAGHWLHAEQTEQVLILIQQFLNQK